jgi:hypothetical protein
MIERKTITARIGGKLVTIHDQLLDKGYTTTDLVKRGLWLVASEEGITA